MLSLRIRAPRRGLTRIDVAVVLAVLVFTIGLGLKAAQNAREAADRMKCQNNLKDIAIGTINCSDTNGGFMPPSMGSYPNAKWDGTLFFHLLPYVEQDKIYFKAGDDKGHSVWLNNTYSARISTFLCPSDSSGGDKNLYDGWLATSSYAGNFLVFGLGGTKFPAGIPDGTSNTIFFTERYQICNRTPCAWAYSAESEWAPVFAYSSVGNFQAQPVQARCNPALPQSNHPGGINVGMGDGSVHTVQPSVNPRTWWIACCPNDGLPFFGWDK